MWNKFNFDSVLDSRKKQRIADKDLFFQVNWLKSAYVFPVAKVKGAKFVKNIIAVFERMIAVQEKGTGINVPIKINNDAHAIKIRALFNRIS